MKTSKPRFAAASSIEITPFVYYEPLYPSSTSQLA